VKVEVKIWESETKGGRNGIRLTRLNFSYS